MYKHRLHKASFNKSRYDYNLSTLKSPKPAPNARAQPSGDILGQCCKICLIISTVCKLK